MAPDPWSQQAAERRAVRLIALSFFAIAAYMTIDAALKLLGLDAHPDQSAVGLANTALSLVVMPALRGQRDGSPLA